MKSVRKEKERLTTDHQLTVTFPFLVHSSFFFHFFFPSHEIHTWASGRFPFTLEKWKGNPSVNPMCKEKVGLCPCTIPKKDGHSPKDSVPVPRPPKEIKECGREEPRYERYRWVSIKYFLGMKACMGLRPVLRTHLSFLGSRLMQFLGLRPTSSLSWDRKEKEKRSQGDEVNKELHLEARAGQGAGSFSSDSSFFRWFPWASPIDFFQRIIK